MWSHFDWSCGEGFLSWWHFYILGWQCPYPQGLAGRGIVWRAWKWYYPYAAASLVIRSLARWTQMEMPERDLRPPMSTEHVVLVQNWHVILPMELQTPIIYVKVPLNHFGSSHLADVLLMALFSFFLCIYLYSHKRERQGLTCCWWT